MPATQQDLQDNLDLCRHPPHQLSEVPPCNTITPRKLSRLRPAEVYTTSKFLNDTIISTTLRLFQQATSFRQERHHLPSYFFTKAYANPLLTDNFFQGTNTRRTHYRPPLEAHTLLIPIFWERRWYLLIRKGHKYMYQDSNDHDTAPMGQNLPTST